MHPLPWMIFKAYLEDGKESDYISGVSQFRSFMTAYLYLNENVSDTEYKWCNTVYGYMLLNPEKVQRNVQGLIDALEYLAEDYDHPGGFNLIHVYSNELAHGNE